MRDTNKIPHIKLLRESFPTLSLRQANNLVNTLRADAEHMERRNLREQANRQIGANCVGTIARLVGQHSLGTITFDEFVRASLVEHSRAYDLLEELEND